MRLTFEACQDQRHFLPILVTQKSTERMSSNIFYWNNAAKKIKIETLKEELKAVFMKKNEFENRVQSRLSDYKNFWRLQFQDFNARSGLKVL